MFSASPARLSRPAVALVLVPGLLAAVGLVALLLWSAPRADIAVPGPDATAEEAVEAYLDAVVARDFATANAIDGRPGDDLGRFSHPTEMHLVAVDGTVSDTCGSKVLFTADVENGDVSMPDGRTFWGICVSRDHDGIWRITDEGVA
ncbi:hypothetical protein [Nocardioides zeae]|uniref:Nuclear transport factor 2 family protein n=1 Tax=Nocardioides zeae TaxID=1457234 RepID=A0A6P0HPJ2_9ACTN|nr:hypothetical protein [Nocardioides zeae]NEN80533.1 hypothetical protein [Nocardioides zeae]